MAKIKKAQDGWMSKAACRRGVCGKGVVSDKRAERMDRKEFKKAEKDQKREDRRYNKELKREERDWKRANLKGGGRIKKAQAGTKLKYKTSDKKYKVKQVDVDNDGVPDTFTKRRTVKGLLSGAPKGGGRMYKSGGKLKSSNKTRKKK